MDQRTYYNQSPGLCYNQGHVLTMTLIVTHITIILSMYTLFSIMCIYIYMYVYIYTMRNICIILIIMIYIYI